MSAAAGHTVDDIVDRLETVSVSKCCPERVRFRAELAVVAVEGEQVVQSIPERDSAVVQDRANRVVQAMGVEIAAAGSAQSGIPIGPLEIKISYCSRYQLGRYLTHRSIVEVLLVDRVKLVRVQWVRNGVGPIGHSDFHERRPHTLRHQTLSVRRSSSPVPVRVTP